MTAGFAHGFVTDDEAIDVDWEIASDEGLLSGKDVSAPTLADLDNPSEWSQS